MKKIFTILLSIAVFGIVYAQSPETADFYFKKGMEEKTGRRYLVASEHFAKAISLRPGFVDAYVQSGMVNKEMRKTDASKTDFIKAVELDPQNEIALSELMELYFNYRQYENAIEIALKCKPGTNRDRVVAISYFQMEDYGKAEKLLVALVNKTPDDAELTYTLGRNYLEMGLETKAIPWYEKATQLNEKNAKWHFELGLLYYNNANYKKAVIAFNLAADNGFTKSNDFKENLGFAYLYSGDVTNGEILINDIIARKPGDTELIRDVATAFFDIKNYDKALDYCQRLLEINFKDGKALYQAGLCFQRKGQVERGMQMCDKAIEIDPSLAGLKSKKLTPGM